MLFKTIPELKEFVSVSIASTFPTIAPFIAYAEKVYIAPLLGTAQYNDLVAAYQAGSMNAAQTNLLAQVQPALANLGYMESYDELQLQISSNGIRIVTDAQYKTAFQWQIRNLKDSNLRRGFAYLDSTLAFLEANPTIYTLWADSDAYTIARQFFINTTDDFNNAVNIQNSRSTFTALWPIMRKVEEFEVRTRIGNALFDEIKSQILAGTVSTANKTLLAWLIPSVAHFTTARAVIELPVQITATGFFVDSIKAIKDNEQEVQAAPEPLMLLKRTQNEQDAQGYMDLMIDYLNANASPTLYAAFYSSTFYKPGTKSTDFYSPSHGYIPATSTTPEQCASKTYGAF